MVTVKLQQEPNPKGIKTHLPVSSASGVGWRALASSAGSRAPWPSAAPAAASWCSPRRPSGWCLCSSACPFKRRINGMLVLPPVAFTVTTDVTSYQILAFEGKCCSSGQGLTRAWRRWTLISQAVISLALRSPRSLEVPDVFNQSWLD